jgi:hypothetical protein
MYLEHIFYLVKIWANNSLTINIFYVKNVFHYVKIAYNEYFSYYMYFLVYNK